MSRWRTNLAFALLAQRRLDEAEASIAETLQLHSRRRRRVAGRERRRLQTRGPRRCRGADRRGAQAAARPAGVPAPPRDDPQGRRVARGRSRRAARSRRRSARRPVRSQSRWAASASISGLVDEARARLEEAVRRGAQSAIAWDNLGLARRRSDDSCGRRCGVHASRLRRTRSSCPLWPISSRLASISATGMASTSLEQQMATLVDDPASDPRLSPSVALGLPLSPEARLNAARRWSRAMLPDPGRAKATPCARKAVESGLPVQRLSGASDRSIDGRAVRAARSASRRDSWLRLWGSRGNAAEAAHREGVRSVARRR